MISLMETSYSVEMKICICWQIEVTTKEQKKWQQKPNVGGKDMGKT